MDGEARSEAKTLIDKLAAVDIDEALSFGHAWVLADPEARPDLERYAKIRLERITRTP